MFFKGARLQGVGFGEWVLGNLFWRRRFLQRGGAVPLLGAVEGASPALGGSVGSAG